MEEIYISNYVPGSIGRIAELHGNYYNKYWNFGLFFEAKVAIELSKLLMEDNPSRNGLWVASVKNKIVGGIAIDGNQREKNEARLRFFIISLDYQGLGIGNLLMEKALRFCKESGFEEVYLTTFAGLDAAKHLYEKWGFKLIEEKEDNTWGVIVKEQLFIFTIR
ncbi:MAG: GNAT family N-acetyltransferase [Thermodesulfobacteriota bacterium]|nr:GNAT family N-acetyltransferase [Thermodesulfobacteriota bacterium]